MSQDKNCCGVWELVEVNLLTWRRPWNARGTTAWSIVRCGSELGMSPWNDEGSAEGVCRKLDGRCVTVQIYDESLKSSLRGKESRYHWPCIQWLGGDAWLLQSGYCGGWLAGGEVSGKGDKGVLSGWSELDWPSSEYCYTMTSWRLSVSHTVTHIQIFHNCVPS